MFYWLGVPTEKTSCGKSVNEVLDMLKPHSKKISILTNPQTNEIMHPLNPYARKAWTIKPLKETK